MILDKIVQQKRKQLQQEKQNISTQEMADKARKIHRVPLDFKATLTQETLGIIAEVKKASPSKGVIQEDFDPIAIASSYEQAGACAISVLTEPYFFQGNAAYLENIRQVVKLPLLKKDFIIDAYQIDEAYVLGADAILLITGLFDTSQLRAFIEHSERYGLAALVEVHTAGELACALDAGAQIIGINNRNLKTFEVDLERTKKLVQYIPKDKCIVSESGFQTYEDLQSVQALGVNGVLIGETLMRAQSIEAEMEALKYGSKAK